MKLTQDQIAEIKKFIHSRGFTHIEVEMEILDHVASAVEVKLESDPNKSITKAIHEVHAGFGPLGFSVMEDEFRKGFGKHYQSIRKGLLKKYLWSERAWVTLLVIMASFALSTILKNLPASFNLVLLLALSSISWLSLYFYFRRVFRKWRKKSMVISHQLGKIGLGSYMIYYTIYYAHEFIGMDFSSTSLLTACLTILSLSTLFTKDCILEVFHWTNERYLKYVR